MIGAAEVATYLPLLALAAGMSELAAAKASSDASERCAITLAAATATATAATAAATAAAAAATAVSTADRSESIGSWRAGIDLSAHLTHHVAVVGEESSMLGATSVLPLASCRMVV